MCPNKPFATLFKWAIGLKRQETKSLDLALTLSPNAGKHGHKNVVHQVERQTVSKNCIPEDEQFRQGELTAKQQPQPSSVRIETRLKGSSIPQKMPHHSRACKQQRWAQKFHQKTQRKGQLKVELRCLHMLSTLGHIDVNSCPITQAKQRWAWSVLRRMNHREHQTDYGINVSFRVVPCSTKYDTES